MCLLQEPATDSEPVEQYDHAEPGEESKPALQRLCCKGRQCLQDAEAREQHDSAAGAPPEHEQTSSSDLEHVEAADAQDSDAGASDSDNDFDKYLNELSGSDEEAGKAPKAEASECGSGEDLDLDDYMRVLASEDKKA